MIDNTQLQTWKAVSEGHSDAGLVEHFQIYAERKGRHGYYGLTESERVIMKMLRKEILKRMNAVLD